jgi:hypothetical protein
MGLSIEISSLKTENRMEDTLVVRTGEELGAREQKKNNKGTLANPSFVYVVRSHASKWVSRGVIKHYQLSS